MEAGETLRAEVEKQSKNRQAAITRLNGYIDNPGKFSILIIGSRGTGKAYWLNKIIAPKKNYIVDSLIATPSEEFWDDTFKEASLNGYLYIKDVDMLSKENQILLIKGLSTSEGKYGYKSKDYSFGVIFSSTKPLPALKDTEKYLYNFFFDRIAQLIVEFPDFTAASDKIELDFTSVWNKFNFKKDREEYPFPKILLPWLRENVHTFNGNYRDLDTICIIWNQYQLDGLQEDDILEKVKNDFNALYKYPEKQSESSYHVNFSRDKQWEETLDEIKSKYKNWAKEEFGAINKIPKSLGVSSRTIERWK